MKIVIFLLGIFLASNADAATGTFWVNGASSGQHCVNSSTDPGSGSSSQTITQGLACVGSAGTDAGAGSTVIVKNGTYGEQLLDKIPNGTAGSPFVLKAENKRGATIQAQVAGHVIQLSNTVHYMTIDGFVLDGQNLDPGAPDADGIFASTFDQTTIHDVIIQNLEIKNVVNQGIQFDGQNITIQNNLIHNGGSADIGFSHGCYCVLTNSIIQDNEISNWAGGYALHFYDAGANSMSGNTVRRNTMFNNNSGVLLNGVNIQFYNNLVYNNGNGVRIQFSVADVVNIYSNTIYNNTGQGLAGIANFAGTNVTAKNNILYLNDGGATSGTINASNNQSTDPSFVNAGAANFYLQNTSTAIDAGVTLGAPFNSDYVNTPRPQGKAYDIGAYEYIFPPSGAPTGMVRFPGGPGVAINSCGSGASVSGNDSIGTVTVGTGTITSCSINFSGTYATTPNCLANLGGTGSTVIGVTPSTSGVTFGTSADIGGGSSHIYYMCAQK